MLKFAGEKTYKLIDWHADVSTAEWAEKNIVFTSEASSAPGKLSLQRTPHLILPLQHWDNKDIYKQVFFASTQTGKTTFMFICIAQALTEDPAPCQLTIPYDAEVSTYVQLKVDPFIESVQRLKERILEHKEDEKIRLKGSMKKVPGGYLAISGNVPLARSARTIKYMFLDEIRLFQPGDVDELVGRTKSFERAGRKIVCASSLEYEGDEAHTQFDMCDAHFEWQMPCSKCKKLFYPTSKTFKYLTREKYRLDNEISDDEFDENKFIVAHKEFGAYIECPNCKHRIDTEARDSMIFEGKMRYVQTKGATLKHYESVGYKLNALGTFITRLETLAKILVDAEVSKDATTVISRIYRDYFNEIYGGAKGDASQEDYFLLDSYYAKYEVPEETQRLGLGVDVQKDHVYWVLTAFCYDSVEMEVAHGKVYGAGVGRDWDFIETMLFDETFKTPDTNRQFRIDICGIDGRGYKSAKDDDEGLDRTIESRQFVARCVQRIEDEGWEKHVFLTLGVDKLPNDKTTRVQKERIGETDMQIEVLSYSNDVIKNALADKISRSIAREKAENTDEAERTEQQKEALMYTSRLFYVDSDTIAEEKELYEKSGRLPRSAFFSHLQAEQYVPAKGKWVKINSSARNDYLDCLCIASACATHLALQLEDKPQPEESDDDATESTLEDGSALLELFG